MRANTLPSLSPNLAQASSAVTPQPENSGGSRRLDRTGNVSTPPTNRSKVNEKDKEKARGEAKRVWDSYTLKNSVIENLYNALFNSKEFKEISEKKYDLQNEINRCVEDREVLQKSELPYSVKNALTEKSWKETYFLEKQLIESAENLLDMLEPHKKRISERLESVEFKSVKKVLTDAIDANTGYDPAFPLKKQKEFKSQLRQDLVSYEDYKKGLQDEINCLEAQHIRWKTRHHPNQRIIEFYEPDNKKSIDDKLQEQMNYLVEIRKASDLLLSIDKNIFVHVPSGGDADTEIFRLATLNLECGEREILHDLYAQQLKIKKDARKQVAPTFTPLKSLKDEVLPSETNEALYIWWSRVKTEVLPGLKTEFEKVNYFISREDIYLKEYARLTKSRGLPETAQEGKNKRKLTRINRGITLQNNKVRWIELLGLIPLHISEKCAPHLDEDIALYLKSLTENINVLHPLLTPSFSKANQAMHMNNMEDCHTAYAEILPLVQKCEDAGEHIQYCLAAVNDMSEKLEKNPNFSGEDHRLLQLATEVLDGLSSEFSGLTRLVRQTLGQLIQNGVDPYKAASLTLHSEYQGELNKINWSVLNKNEPETDSFFSPGTTVASESVDLSRTSATSRTSGRRRKGKRRSSAKSQTSSVAGPSKETTLSSALDSVKLSEGQELLMEEPESLLMESPQDMEVNREKAREIFDGVVESLDNIELSVERELNRAERILEVLGEKRADVFKEDAKRVYASPDGVRIFYESAINKKISQIRSLKVALQKIDRLESKDPNVLEIRTEIMVRHIENKRKKEELIAESIAKTATAHTLDPKESMFDFMEKYQLIRGAELIIPDAPLRTGDWVHKWVVTLNSGEGFRYHLKYDEKNPADDTKFTHSSLKRMDQEFVTITLLREQGRTDEYLFRGAVEGVKILDTLKKYKAGPEEAEVLQNIRRRRTY